METVAGTLLMLLEAWTKLKSKISSVSDITAISSVKSVSVKPPSPV